MNRRSAPLQRPMGWRRMAWMAFPMLVLVLGITPTTSWAGLQAGLRFGWADVSDEVFTGSGDLGGTNLIGLHVVFGLGPLLDIEVAGEYTSKEFSFTEGLTQAGEKAGKGDWEDITLLATGRFNVIGFAFLPLHGYVGGGLNVHWIDLAVTGTPDSGQDGPADNGVAATIEDLAGDRSEAGWHAVVGVRLGAPGASLSAFAEARYLRGFDPDQVPASKAIYLGVTIGF